jgi:hypothetical protein
MLIEREPNAASGGELARISQEVTERFYNLSPVAHSVRCPSWVDGVDKGGDLTGEAAVMAFWRDRTCLVLSPLAKERRH